MKKLRGAVVGVGYLGRFHAQKYKALALELEFDFVGVCDANQSLGEAVSKELSVPWFAKAEELLGQVDFVSIATTTPSHYALAKLFLNQGVHVNVEKPMTVKLSEAEELVALAKSKNLFLAVGHSERFSPLVAKLKNSMESVDFIELQRHAPFKTRGAEVSVVLDLMVHDLDLLCALTGEFRPKLLSVQTGRAMTSNEDWAQALYEISSGKKALVSVSRLAPEMQRQVKLYSGSKVLTANFQTGDFSIGQKSATKPSEFSWETSNLGKSDNLMCETRNFVLSLKSQDQLLIPGEQGLAVLRLAQEVIEKGSL